MTNVHKCPNCGGFPVDRPGPLETENERLRRENETLFKEDRRLRSELARTEQILRAARILAKTPRYAMRFPDRQDELQRLFALRDEREKGTRI